MSKSDDKAEDDEVELTVSEAIVREKVEGFGKVGLLWIYFLFNFIFLFNFWGYVFGSGFVIILKISIHIIFSF